MPLSFWIFLGVSIASFVVVINDHSEAWEQLKEAKCKKKKFLKSLHVFALWFVAAFSLVGTLILGRESFRSDEEDAQRDAEYASVSNKLAWSDSRLKDEKRKVMELEAKVSDRTITPKNRRTFIELVRSEPKGDVSVIVNLYGASEEAKRYATDILNMLRDAGYRVPTSIGAKGYLATPRGVIMLARKDGATLQGAVPIAQALKKIGITVGISPERDFKATNVTILVGEKD